MATGMVDIARQTVEFLYEENGGIPRDLYLPTIEDIKDEANKFTIDKVRKGTFTCIIISCWNYNFNFEKSQSLTSGNIVSTLFSAFSLSLTISCFFNAGLTVVIRCPDSNNTNSTTGGTALPKFAIRGMLKTFGLHGVVLDVDSVSTILQCFGTSVFCTFTVNLLVTVPAGLRIIISLGLQMTQW